MKPFLYGLMCSGQGWAVLPDELMIKAKYAQSIDLSKNRLTNLPDNFALTCHRHLQRLSLSSNLLTILPEDFGRLTGLKWLDMTHNRISALPDSIGNLQELQSFGASDMALRELPKSFFKLAALRKVGLFNNVLQSLPREIGQLKHLTKLDLSGNELRELPKEIGCLSRLEWLNLSGNRLQSLPAEFGKLAELVEVGLCNNKLTEIPDISKLSRLQILSIYGNELASLPLIDSLVSLKKFDASNNRLTECHSAIFSLANIEYINIRGNMISFIDDGVRLGRSLEKIDLRDNHLKSLPSAFFNKMSIELRAMGNPFSSAAMTPAINFPKLAQLIDQSSIINNVNLPAHLHSLLDYASALMCSGCGRPFVWQGGWVGERWTGWEGCEMAIRHVVCSKHCHSVVSKQIIKK